MIFLHLGIPLALSVECASGLLNLKLHILRKKKFLTGKKTSKTSKLSEEPAFHGPRFHLALITLSSPTRPHQLFLYEIITGRPMRIPYMAWAIEDSNLVSSDILYY